MTDPATDPVPELTREQRNGRQLLVLALTTLGAIPLLTLTIKQSGFAALVACAVGYGVIVHFAFRGGRISMGLLKGFSLLMGLVFTILLTTLAIWIVRDGQLPEQVGRSPWEIAVPALFAYFAIAILFFSKSARLFLQFQRDRFARTALLLLLSALSLQAASPATPQATPQAAPLDRYEALIARSPFAPSSAPATATPITSFTKDYYLTGLATIGGKAFASLSSRDHQTRFSLLEGESYDGITFTGVEWSPAIGQSRAILNKDGTTGTVTFDEVAMKAAPPPAAPTASSSPQERQERRRGRSRWEGERSRWRRDRGDWSPEQRQFMRERRRALFRATYGQGQEGARQQYQRQQPINGSR